MKFRCFNLKKPGVLTSYFLALLIENMILSRLYPKLITRFCLWGKNPDFLANTFSTSQIIDEVKK